MIALFNEVNYDIMVHLTQPSNSLFPIFSVYGFTIPLNFFLGYCGAFTVMCYISYRIVKKFPTKKGLTYLWLGIVVACLVLELPNLLTGIYVYHGEQMLRICGYPIYNLWMNATGWMLCGMLIAAFEPALKGWKRVLLSVLPCLGFAMAWGMCAIPIFSALNIQGLRLIVKYILMFVSFGLAILVSRTAINMLVVDSKTRWKIPWDLGFDEAKVINNEEIKVQD